MEDPVHGACFCFQPQVQSTAAPRFFQPSDLDTVRAFPHLALLRFSLLLPIGTDPNFCLKQELSLPSLGYNFDQYYQAAVDWWEKQALSSQPASFLSSPSPNFSCRIMNYGTFSLAGEFAAAPTFSKTVTQLDL